MPHKTRAARRANEARRKLAAYKQRPRTAAEQAEAREKNKAGEGFWTFARLRAWYAGWQQQGSPPAEIRKAEFEHRTAAFRRGA